MSFPSSVRGGGGSKNEERHRRPGNSIGEKGMLHPSGAWCVQWRRTRHEEDILLFGQGKEEEERKSRKEVADGDRGKSSAWEKEGREGRQRTNSGGGQRGRETLASLSRRRRRNSRPRASKNPRRRTTGNEDRLSRQQEGEEQLTVHRDLWLLLRSTVVEREPPRNICSTWKHSNNIRIMRRILHTPANVAQLLATCSYLFFRVFRT